MLRRFAFPLLLLLLLPASAAAQPEPYASAEGVVRELYAAVTFPAGATPDWDHVRKLFLPSADVVLRTSRTESTVFTVDGFVADFVKFIEDSGVGHSGFSERIVRLVPTVFGDIAHVWVLYEASIPTSSRPPQQGVDSFQLFRQDGRWWIVSIVNELPSPANPLPEILAQ